MDVLALVKIGAVLISVICGSLVAPPSRMFGYASSCSAGAASRFSVLLQFLS